MSGRCPTCGEWNPICGGKHVCPPKWFVWDDDDGPEFAVAVHAVDEEWAAEKWAEMMDGPNDHFITASGCDGVVVTVGSNTTVPGKRIRVFGEPTVTYHAKEETVENKHAPHRRKA